MFIVMVLMYPNVEVGMVEAQPGVARWKSDKAKEDFHRLYAAASDEAWQDLERRQLHDLPERLDVSTGFGVTAAFHWAGTGVPVVLLHGQNATSLMWAPLLAELPHRNIYALDIVGEAGASAQTKPITDIGELVQWLDETLRGLGLDQAHLAGTSFGAWPATHYAAAHPQQVKSLSLLEPAIDAVTMGRFLRHGMAVGAAQLLPRALRGRLARRLDADALVMADRRVRTLGSLTFRKHERGLPKYAQIVNATPDNVLAALRVPTLLVLAGRSELHDTQQVAERAQRLIRGAEVHVVPRASHALPVTKPEVVGPILRSFLDAHEHAATDTHQNDRATTP
jgi:pimeloyl-ACP methyl ester carboxylesterase